MTYKVSVIIPTLNAEKYLPKLLDKLSKQTLKNFELIIVDSSSTDNTGEIVKRYTDRIIVIPRNEFDHGGTRTSAGKLARDEFLVYLTQDAIPYDKHTLENIIKVFKDPLMGAAYGKQISYPDTNFFGKFLREFNYPNNSLVKTREDVSKLGIKTPFISNSFACYRKEALRKVGWFKNGLILGEDVYAGAKLLLAGYKIAYVAEAKVYHSHNYSIWEEFRRYFDIGVFHEMESWILDTFGNSEREGVKYIFSELNYLLKNKKWYLIPEWFIRNFFKYLGYKLGRNYRKLQNLRQKAISFS
jgi:rhamnosyltransferase